MSTNENAFANGEWRGGRFYPHGSQSDFASTLAERAERQRQESGIEPGDDLDELPARPPKSIPDADLQLLDLAARALGAVFEEVDGEGYGNLHFEDGSSVNAWNPLQFSGDTFELGARLSLFDDHATFQHHLATELSRGGDPLMAHKRAVVLTAAGTGKQHS